MSKVVNVKVQYIRPEHTNLKQWIMDPNNVYIGRGKIVFVDSARFPPEDSVFCNPFKIGKDGTREQVIQKYEEYVKHKIDTDPEFARAVRDLKGKTLGCWCAPEPCHGHVLAKLATELRS
jgi:hypothetical protein